MAACSATFPLHGEASGGRIGGLEAGGTLRELQELVGWQTLKMVERYRKVTRMRIRETLDRVALPTVEQAYECTVSTRNPDAKIAILAK